MNSVGGYHVINIAKKNTDVSDISEMPNIYFDGNFFIILIP